MQRPLTSLLLVGALALPALSAQSPTKIPLPAKPAHRTAKADRKLERRWARPVASHAATRTPAPGPQAATEQEHNGTVGWADSFGGQPDYDGDIAFAGDLDLVRIVVPSDSFVRFDVSQSGATPIADATLLIRDASGQFVAYNDDRAGSLMPLIDIPMLAGTYFCELAGYAANIGTYKLTTTVTPTTFTVVNPGVPVNGTVPVGGETAFLLPLVADARVNLTISANGGQDLYLACLRSSGAVHRFVDDTGGTLDPALETHLVAGFYMLVFGDLNGAGGAFTFTVAQTIGVPPSVNCGGFVSGTTVDDRSLEIFQLNVATPSTIDLNTGPSGGTPMTDGIMTIYDRNLNMILWNDDTSGLHSRMNIPLPAGLYYVGVEAYSPSSAGTFDLNAVCVPSVSVAPARFGVTAGGNVANPGDVAAHSITTGTPVPVEVLVDTSLTSLPDPMLAILDAAGNCLAYDDDSGPGTDSYGGNAFGVGTHWILVRDYGSGTGTFDLATSGRMTFPATTKGNLELKDKAGNVVFPYAAASLLGVPFPLPLPLTGNLVLDPATLVPLPAVQIPATGLLTYPVVFPNGPYFVQGISVTFTPLSGAMSNVAN